MRLKRIKLQNFLSYERLNFQFHDKNDSDPAIFIITGINNDTETASDNSNGSGKSTLVGESITFNLFGKNLRGSTKKIRLENAIKFGESALVNEAEYFIEGNAVLKIRREKERDGRSSLEVEVDGHTKSKRLKRLSETDIRDFLGIDPDVYYQTVSYYKDNPSLLAMNYSQRLDFFKKFVNLTIMDTYYQQCKKYATEIDSKLIATKTKKQAQLDIIAAINSNDTKYLEILNDALAKISKELAEVESVPEQDYTDLSDKLDQLSLLVKQIDVQIRDLTQKNRLDAATIKKVEEEIKNFEHLKNTNCPTCGQEVSGKYADEIIVTKKAYIEALNVAIKEREVSLESLSEKSIKADDKADKIEKKIEKIKSDNTVRRIKLQSLNKQKKEKEDELKAFKNAMRSEEDTSEYQLLVQKLEKAEKLLERRKEINNFWLENLASKSPVRSAIIRKHINFLSDIFEYYIGKLFRNTIIGKMEIDNDGNIDILLTSDGYEVNYWNLSSGEKKRADLAMLFALYVYLLNMVPNAPKFLVLDECLDSVDSVGITAITETIADIFRTYEVDIFIISHIEFPEIVFENLNVKKIIVTKNNGCSTAEYA